MDGRVGRRCERRRGGRIGYVQTSVSISWYEVILFRPHTIRVSSNLGKAVRGGHLIVRECTIGCSDVIRLPCQREELHERYLRHPTEASQIANFKRLNEDVRLAAGVAVSVEDSHEWSFH